MRMDCTPSNIIETRLYRFMIQFKILSALCWLKSYIFIIIIINIIISPLDIK